MSELTEPLRLAVGSHAAGSGRGCAMNVVSWENGDMVITDFPDCSDQVLASIVQNVNDCFCAHRDGDLLCPRCSVQMLDLGHRTVGTGVELNLSESDRRRVWVRVAVDQARQVQDKIPPRFFDAAACAIDAAEAWADNPNAAYSNAAHAAGAANAAIAAAVHAAASNAANAARAAIGAIAAAAHAANAAHAARAATTGAYAAARAATTGAYAAAGAANAAIAATTGAYANAVHAAATERLHLAHRAIDVFDQWTGHTPTAPDPGRTAAAVRQMTTV